MVIKKNIVYVFFAISIVPTALLGVQLNNAILWPLWPLLLSVAIYRSFTIPNEFLILLLFPMLFSVSAYAGEMHIKDIAEILKPLLQFVLLCVGYSVGKKLTPEMINSTVVTFIVMCSFTALLVQYGLPDQVSDLWKARKSTEAWNFHSTRLNGFFPYPDLFGYIITLGYSVVLFSKNQRYRFLLSVLFFIVILLSLSRGGILFFLLISCVYVLRKLSIRTLIASIILLSLMFVTVPMIQSAFPSFDYVFDLVGGKMDGSVYARLFEIQSLLHDFYIVGNGPSNNYFIENKIAVEAAIYYYTYKFGVFGVFFLVVFGLLIYVLPRSCFGFKVWATLGLTIGLFTVSFLDETKLSTIFLLLLGGYYGAVRNPRVCADKRLP